MNSRPPSTPIGRKVALETGVKSEIDDMVRSLMVLSDGAEKREYTTNVCSLSNVKKYCVSCLVRSENYAQSVLT